MGFGRIAILGCWVARPGGGGPEGPYGLLGPIIIPPAPPAPIPAIELGGI